jgi:hypothetical protein
MWRGKRKKSPNQHGTRSLLDIFPVRATIKAIPFPNDNNATKGAYLSSSSSTPSATKTAPKKRPSRVAKKTVSYCNTNDEDGYELKKKAKANTTDATAMRRRLSDPRQIRIREPRIRRLWQKYFKRFHSLTA